MKHIYIHWPFCKSKCSYCDFTSFANAEQYQKEYCDALCNEIKNYFENNTTEVETIFFGGGSPSLCPPECLEKIMGAFPRTDKQEITIEANPADVTEEKLKFWKSVGINRLSVGVQTLNDEVLLKLKRRQTTKDVFALMDIAPKYFENISIDLILGLPGVSEKMWQDTLNQIVDFPITHVSVYFLTLYKNTPLSKCVQNKEVSLLNDDDFVARYQQTVEFLDKKGFIQYEISNFSKPGYQSVHNCAYWNYKHYKGFGVSAASFDGETRTVNTKNLKNYLNCWYNFAKCGKKYDLEEFLTEDQKKTEQLMLGLRLKKGMGLQRMIYLLSSEQNERLQDIVSDLKSQSLLEEKNGRVFLTTRGMALENEIVLKLLG
jgi:oxygen-independent coproporphyrinogen III oxidase